MHIWLKTHRIFSQVITADAKSVESEQKINFSVRAVLYCNSDASIATDGTVAQSLSHCILAFDHLHASYGQSYSSCLFTHLFMSSSLGLSNIKHRYLDWFALVFIDCTQKPINNDTNNDIINTEH